MEKCNSVAEVSGYVWKYSLALQRLVDMYGRMHYYSRGFWICMEECASNAEASGYVWKYALALQRLVDMYGRMP